MTTTYNNLIPYEGLDTNPNPIAQVARGLRDGLCGLHSTLPYGNAPFGIGQLRREVEGFWNGVCQRPESPFAPVPAEARGCTGTTYLVTGTYRFFGEEKTFSNTFNGQVVSAAWRPIPSGTSLGINVIDVRFCDGGETFFGAPDASSPDNFQRGGIAIDVVGQEGTVCCGSITPPPTPNVLPPEITINLPGSGPIIIPVTWPEVNLDVGGNIIGFAPVIITPIGRFNFTLPGIEFNPRFNLNPDITIPIGGGGDGGATEGEIQQIVNNQTTEIIQQLDVPIDDIIQLLNAIIDLINGLDFQCDLQPVLDLINCYFLEESTESDVRVLQTNSDGRRVTLPPNTTSVLIELVQPAPTSIRVQSGSGIAENVFYWGWFSINYDFNAVDGVRQELHYATQSVRVEKNARSITVNPIRGARFNLAVFTRTFACSTTEE